jgi:DNA polymerase-3 subunit delta
MQPDELRRRLARGDVAALYFLHGNNGFLIQEAIGEITAQLFDSRTAAPDIEHLDAREHKPADILARARTVPLWSARQLIVVKSADAFKHTHWQSFEGYFQNPCPHCCLVFVAEKMPLTGALLAGFEGQGAAVCFKSPQREQDIKQFIRARLHLQGKSASPDALQALAEQMASDTQVMAREIEKLCLYCGTAQTVTLADVQQALSGGHADTIFALVDEVAGGQAAASLPVLHNVLEQGVHPLAVLKMLARQFKLISAAREELAGGATSERIGKRLGLKPFIVKKIAHQARAWSGTGLSRAYDELMRTDFLLKAGSQIDGGIVLEHLIFRLADIRRQA